MAFRAERIGIPSTADCYFAGDGLTPRPTLNRRTFAVCHDHEETEQ
jgi:hypothetical protein